MSTIGTSIQVSNQDTGLAFSLPFVSRTTSSPGFSVGEITVTTADDPVTTEYLTPRNVMIRLLSGDDVKVGFSDSVYPMRLSGVDDSALLRLDVEGLREISTFTCGDDTDGSLNQKHILLGLPDGDILGVWFDLGLKATASITYGTPVGAVKATVTLTNDTTNVSNNDEVVLGDKTYTFKTTLTPSEGEVLIGGDADASLLNLIRAINHTGTPDTHYKCAAAHTQVSAAASVTAHSVLITSLLGGTDANDYETTTSSTGTVLEFSAATMTGGVNGDTVVVNGTVLTCTTFTPGALQFNTIGSLETLVEAVTGINSSENGTVVTLTAATPGVAGNFLTLTLGGLNVGTMARTVFAGGADSGATAPAPAADRLLSVNFAANATGTTIATAIAAAIEADNQFTATSSLSVVTAISQHTGTRSVVTIGDTGWASPTASGTGAASPVVHLRSLGTSQVVVAVAPN